MPALRNRRQTGKRSVFFIFHFSFFIFHFSFFIFHFWFFIAVFFSSLNSICAFPVNRHRPLIPVISSGEAHPDQKKSVTAFRDLRYTYKGQ